MYMHTQRIAPFLMFILSGVPPYRVRSLTAPTVALSDVSTPFSFSGAASIFWAGPQKPSVSPTGLFAPQPAVCSRCGRDAAEEQRAGCGIRARVASPSN